MSKDASEFSLKHVEWLIKPEITHLPFKRLRDYLEQRKGGPQIDNIVWQLRFWKKQTTIPGDVETEWKAIRFGLEQNVVLNDSAINRRPKSIELISIIMVCPTNESFLWFLQVSKFFPVSKESFYFDGKSRLVSINNEDFAKTVCLQPASEKKFWKEVIAWLTASIEDRRFINERHERLKSSLIARI